MADLVTLEQVKGYLGEETYLMDTQLSGLISTASALIRRYLDPIEHTTYTDELYDGNGGQWLQLLHWPLKVGDTTRVVKINGVTVTGCKWVERIGRIYYPGGWPVDVQNIALTYMAGYGVTVPDDIKGACLMLVKFYAKSDLLARSVFFEGGGGMGAERALPSQVREILESYPSCRRR